MFEIKKGSFVIFKGVSGSGKSTLLAALAGDLPPASGVIVLNAQGVAVLAQDHRGHLVVADPAVGRHLAGLQRRARFLRRRGGIRDLSQSDREQQ